MKTDDLIAALAADLPSRPTPVNRAVAQALMISVPIAVLIHFTLIHVRPDIATVAGDPRFIFKFLFTLSVLGAGMWIALRLSRPAINAGPARIAVGLAAALLAVGVVVELLILPRGTWMPTLVGTNAAACLVLIPVLSTAPLAALLVAFRSGAPESPALAGAAAGLAASAVGATLYATHCIDDSPLFVGVWYVLAMAAVTAIGSLVGSRVLRW